VDPHKPLLGARIRSASKDAQYQMEACAESQPTLADHRVDGQTVFPLAGYVEMALEAGARRIDDVVIEQAFILDAAEPATIQFIVSPDRRFEIYSSSNQGVSSGEWRRHVTGRIEIDPGSYPEIELDRDACQKQVFAEQHYEKLHGIGLEYGPEFRK